MKKKVHSARRRFCFCFQSPSSVVWLTSCWSTNKKIILQTLGSLYTTQHCRHFQACCVLTLLLVPSNCPCGARILHCARGHSKNINPRKTHTHTGSFTTRPVVGEVEPLHYFLQLVDGQHGRTEYSVETSSTMEELQDAIEDAQYVNAIATQEDGPRPVLAWENPSPETLQAWENNKLSNNPKSFELDTLLESPIGLFLFSSFVKTHHEDFLRINFCEDIIRYKKARGKTKLEMGYRLVNRYLTKTEETKPPSKTHIQEYDLSRHVNQSASFILQEESFQQAMDYPICSESFVGLKGSIREEVCKNWMQQEKAERLRKSQAESRSGTMEIPSAITEGRTDEENYELGNDTKHREPVNRSESDLSLKQQSTDNIILQMQTTESMRSLTQKFKSSASFLRDNVFDVAEALVMESLRREYWQQFQESEEYAKLKRFMWYGDRRVVPDDFFTMRVLGRGGFGLVTGALKMNV